MRFLPLCLLAGLVCIPAIVAAQNRVLYSFESENDLKNITTLSSEYALTKKPVVAGKSALQMTFKPADWPKVEFEYPTPLDVREYAGLAFELVNPSGETLPFGFRIDDQPNSNGVLHCRTASGTIAAKKTVTYVVPFNSIDPMAVGMRGLPRPSFTGMTVLSAGGSGEFDLSHIVCYQLFMHLPETPKTLVVDNIRLVKAENGVGLNIKDALTNMADKYGQYAHADWPGKLKSDDEFAQRLKTEDADLKKIPALQDRDQYGGWSKGPQLAATGFFRTEKANGKWWFVDPAGHLFFSLGVDSMGIGPDTITTGREYMFSWIPGKDDPLFQQSLGYVRGVHSGPVKEGATMNFYKANLIRKYGKDNFSQVFIDRALRRLPSWGFNTIGNWPDSRFYGNGKVPYVVCTGIGLNNVNTVSSGNDYWRKMVDPYDPRFASEIHNAVKGVADKVKNDPLCIGYFFGNEESWGSGGSDQSRYGLSIGSLALPADGSYTKQAILAELQSRYGDITKLNTAWGTSFASWDAMKAPVTLPKTLTAACVKDLSAFLKNFARQYFRVVNAELKKVDPNHLYLGCRFAWYTQEEVEAAAEICDVVSFNIYRPSVDQKAWGFLNDLNKPCIIGEFHFGALDRGMLHTGLVATASQQERAETYIKYVRSVADNPAFIGCHWFQYIDEPLTGRSYDGENYNIGFLTVTDTPYPEMVQAARTVHQEVYPRRYGATK
ncbi:MAG TPA: beta-galactosidase [Armatimonadota bacterium]|nr:beta-galactosidase [Armatimonadota bacterium]